MKFSIFNRLTNERYDGQDFCMAQSTAYGPAQLFIFNKARVVTGIYFITDKESEDIPKLLVGDEYITNDLAIKRVK